MTKTSPLGGGGNKVTHIDHVAEFLFKLTAATSGSGLRWVHTCNVTAYRNAVTLQETDKIRSYELKFHPVPHGVTVSCERYT